MSQGATAPAGSSAGWGIGTAVDALRVCGAVGIDADVLVAGPSAGAVAARLVPLVRRCHALAPAADAGPRTLVLDASAVQLPFADGELDAVVLDRVDDEPALAEIARVLCDLGVLVLVRETRGRDGDTIAGEITAAGAWTTINVPVLSDGLAVLVLRRNARRRPRPAWNPPAQAEQTRMGAPDEKARLRAADADPVIALARFLPEPLVVIDGGCRGGFQKHWLRLGPHVRLYGFDADARECEVMRREIAGLPGAGVVALALGAQAGQATFFVPRNAVGGSLLPPDLQNTNHLPSLDGAQPADEFDVEIVRLDAWAEAEGIGRIDAIKLDIEGGELEALRGSTGVLGQVRAVEVEVRFNATNVGAPMFGDVDAFLREQGFALWRIREPAHYRLRGAEQADLPVSGEIVYFACGDALDYEMIDGRPGQLMWANAHWVATSAFRNPPAASWDAHLRDALIAHVLAFHDLAHVALRRALLSAPPASVAADLRALLPRGAETSA